MAKTPPRRVYKVELFVEVPETTSHPKDWNWDFLVNDGLSRSAKSTPVTFVLAHEVKEGQA